MTGFLCILEAVFEDFRCQNEVNFGGKSNRTGASAQKGLLLRYPIRTNEFSMFLFDPGGGFSFKISENGAKIEVGIRTPFFLRFRVGFVTFFVVFGC